MVRRRDFLLGLTLAACVPVRAVDVPPNVPRKGAKKPELVVQEIGDFECSFCAAVQPAVERVMAAYGERVALLWRDYPLDRHPHALGAAEAAREVRAQLGDEAFWKYHAVLFRNQRALAPADLLRYAAALGVDPKRMASALELGIHRDGVLSDKREIDALALPSFGTPAFIIGADVFVGNYGYDELAELVEAAL
ncbi:MAG: thioredoxin domain-containing protein [Myxococcales bacterium]|nr:thioredoxin domain-containing protein [Myxococcales bacterium]